MLKIRYIIRLLVRQCSLPMWPPAAPSSRDLPRFIEMTRDRPLRGHRPHRRHRRGRGARHAPLWGRPAVRRLGALLGRTRGREPEERAVGHAPLAQGGRGRLAAGALRQARARPLRRRHRRPRLDPAARPLRDQLHAAPLRVDPFHRRSRHPRGHDQPRGGRGASEPHQVRPTPAPRRMHAAVARHPVHVSVPWVWQRALQ
mmetsp:Transcript_49433/g.165043  ORF Transcript_49433/g.165043 Transcript_49433/m.165043 type:complete len:201 (-) Transcript_49433:94-696(-)